MSGVARIARYTTATARSVVAAFAASTAAILACAVVPVILMRMPLGAILAPSRPFLIFALAYSGTVGIPFFVLLSRRRRLGLGSYVLHSTELACLAMIAVGMDYTAPSPFQLRAIFDLMWVILTSAVPGGAVAGALAYATMSIGQPQEIAARP